MHAVYVRLMRRIADLESELADLAAQSERYREEASEATRIGYFFKNEAERLQDEFDKLLARRHE